jgi:hypothetical protein
VLDATGMESLAYGLKPGSPLDWSVTYPSCEAAEAAIDATLLSDDWILAGSIATDEAPSSGASE